MVSVVLSFKYSLKRYQISVYSRCNYSYIITLLSDMEILKLEYS